MIVFNKVVLQVIKVCANVFVFLILTICVLGCVCVCGWADWDILNMCLLFLNTNNKKKNVLEASSRTSNAFNLIRFYWQGLFLNADLDSSDR